MKEQILLTRKDTRVLNKLYITIWKLKTCPRAFTASSKPTTFDEFVEALASAAARVALEIDVEADDVVDPIGRHVQKVSRLQDDLIAHHLGKVRKLFQVWFGPIYFGVAAAGMRVGQHVHVFALVGVGQDPAPQTPRR